MTRISFFFAILRAKNGINIISKTTGSFQKFIFSCCLIISHCSFHKMTKTIKFMMIFQFCKRFIHAVNNVICIKIARIMLSSTHDINSFICNLHKFFVFMPRQRICNCFYPFGKICILKNKTIKMLVIWFTRIWRNCIKTTIRVCWRHIRRTRITFFFHHFAGNTKIMHTITWGGIWNSIV